MPERTLKTILALLLVAGLVAACATLPRRYTLPDVHPYPLDKGRTDCLECHDRADDQVVYANFVHTPDWTNQHRGPAYQGEAVCAMCHTQSFCNDCHVTRSELKPSLKNQTDTYLRTPHRGDYLSRHRIDGRLNPTSCFRCHGNPKASKTCAPCHG
ncbi:MAG: nitrate reductase cytochrome c-type subunit [Deferrisomatales bacterium]